MTSHENLIPTAASAWTEETLDHLNTKYVKNACTEFSFPNLGISKELENGESLFLGTDG